ncbi:cell division cycle protein 20 homolog B [Oryzias latipes]|uniref:CDC20/Fizzy WD40 domain-containing protein n=1 Tax=Oryzias latipes TaxID=8090 RepID=A0A3B3HHD1_ORYLA|nr:cell division cycle protein 20 homolog B [Oryzias latipes]
MQRTPGKRKSGPFEGQNHVSEVTYKRFKKGIIQKLTRKGPAASTPMATRGQYDPRFDLAEVCQRLDLETQQSHQEPEHEVQQGNSDAIPHMRDCREAVNPPRTPFSKSKETDNKGNSTEQGGKLVWRAAETLRYSRKGTAGSEVKKQSLQPFALLNKDHLSQHGQVVMMLGAPSLRNDYYSDLLDCNRRGIIALALGSSVYLWNSETRALVGLLEPCLAPDGPSSETLSISCLCWSRDGRILSIGNRRGEIQLWDADRMQTVRSQQSHLSAVAALSWKQDVLSSGSVLGRVHHTDARAPAQLVGAADLKEEICSLQWSPGQEWMASGSTNGLLHIWANDIGGIKKSCQTVVTMKQPSAVKAMGWCPWQRGVIATGGGWKDGELRMWDAQLGTCLNSVSTNSQICCLRWAGKKRSLITSHGLPHNSVSSWTWKFPYLTQLYQLAGHSGRVLHLAVNSDGTCIFSAGADQRLHIWDL